MTTREMRPFAHPLSLDPGVIYLNHGAVGACPRVVQSAQREFRARLERNPVHFFMRELERSLDVTRAVLGPFVGAAPDDIAFVPNATAGVNTVVSALEFAAGDEIVVNDHTYPAFLCAALGTPHPSGFRAHRGPSVQLRA